MLSLLALSLATQNPVCDSTRQLYQDYACCGGGGHSVCTSEKVNFTKLLADITHAIGSAPSPTPSPSPPSIPRNIFETCGIESEVTFNTLGIWPPDGEDATLFTGYGGLPLSSWPHITRNDVLMPAFFGMCTNFQFAAGQVSEVPEGAVKDKLTEMLRMFSDILSVSYHTGAGNVRISTAYVESMATVWRNKYNTQYVAALQAAYNATQMKIFNGLATSLVSSYESHITAAKANTYPSRESELNFAMEALQGTTLYPKYFSYCQASKNLWDFMLPIPAQVYPTLGSPTRMFRCSAVGMKMLKVQSDILDWENVNQRCPSVAEMKATADSYTNALKASSDFIYGTSARVVCSRPGCSDANMLGEPANTESFYINGRDWGFHMNLWLTFLEAHVLRGLGHCNRTWVVSDPTGFTGREVRLDSSWFYNAMQRFQAAFPWSFSGMWASPYPQCPDYKYRKHLFPCTDTPYSGCNNALVPPLEDNCTMTIYNTEWKGRNVNAIVPATVQNDIQWIWPEDDECSFDPLGRAKSSKVNFPMNESSSLDPLASPLADQFLQFFNLSDYEDVCSMNMTAFPVRDGDLSFLVPPWELSSFTFANVIGPLCPRCS